MLRHLLTTAQQALSQSSPTPRLDAEILLAHVLGWTRTHLFASYDHVPDQTQITTFQQLVARRAELEPVAYLVGQREFYGLTMLVDQRVLIPRPETELLVELALQQARQRLANISHPLHIVDVGTGSGAIALALAYHLPGVRVTATDLSRGALEVAAANRTRHNLDEQVTLLHGDLLTPITEHADIIVSNPPYTLLDEIEPGVRLYEPHLALDGGTDGLDVYRRLLEQAPRWLNPGGGILLEIGATQAEHVVALARAALGEPQLAVHRDLAGHSRVVVAQT